MNKRNIIILTIMILIIIIIVGLYYLKNERNDDNNIIIVEEAEIQLLEVKDIRKLYSIEECVEKYLNGRYEVSDIVEDYNRSESFYLNKAYMIESNSKNTIYFVDGILIKANDTNKRNLKLILTVDNQNTTYNIAKYGDKYTDIFNYTDDISNITVNKQKIRGINENIEYQSYNYWYYSETITDEQLAKRFYEEFKIDAIYFEKDLYSKLDEDYRKQRFDSYETFKKYMQKFKTVIEESTLSKFSINKIGYYTEIILVDTHQNNFIIVTNESPMDYTVFLDNYTIKTDGYEERYNKLTNQEKITTNINIFMNMINTADYKNAYKLLDDTFKLNNFKTENLFEAYVNNNFFDYNIVNLKYIKEQGSYYVCNLEIKNNNSRASEKKELSIIMKLLEGTDFVMSFNIK